MKEEEKLINKAKKGDKNAFGRLYDKYIGAIYRFVLVKVGVKEDAEDLTHQVFLSAWTGLPKYNYQGHPFSSWLYRIAQNAVIDFYRTSKTTCDIETVSEDAVALKPDFDKRFDDAMQIQLVKAVMTELEPEHSNVLIMKFVNDMSNKEIALVLQKSEGAVRVIQHRALKQLRTKIDANQGYNQNIKEI